MGLSLQGCVQVSLIRIARKYRARLTQDSVKLSGFIEDFGKALEGFLQHPNEATARRLIHLAGSSRKDLTLTFENPEMEESLPDKVLEHYQVLLAVLSGIGEATDVRSLNEVISRFEQRSPMPLPMLLMVLFQEAVNLVDSFDVDILDHFSVGPYSLLLASSVDADWDEGKVHVAQETLEQVTKKLHGAGFGRFAGGKVQAYAGGELPPGAGASSPGTDGIYNYGTDTFWMAVGSPDSLVQTMVHETGHRVYYRGLSGNGREVWDSFYDSLVKKPGSILTRVLKAWHRVYADALAAGKSEAEAGWVGTFLKSIQTDSELGMWTQIIAQQFTDSGQIQLSDVERDKSRIKIFMQPVTPYSTVSARELYAEVFSHYIMLGPLRIPDVVRGMFEKVTSGLKFR